MPALRTISRRLYHFVRTSYYAINDSHPLIALLSYPRHLITSVCLSLIKPSHLLVGEPRSLRPWFSCSYTFFAPFLFDLTSDRCPSNISTYIVADNVLEHIPRHKIDQAISNLFSLTSQSGTLLLLVPDAYAICSDYLNLSLTPEKFVKDFAKQYSIPCTYSTDLLRLSFHAFGHSDGTILDYQMLSTLLRKVGFSDVKHISLSALDDTPFADLPFRRQEYDLRYTLIVIAHK